MNDSFIVGELKRVTDLRNNPQRFIRLVAIKAVSQYVNRYSGRV
jgi:hypothetical protein